MRIKAIFNILIIVIPLVTNSCNSDDELLLQADQYLIFGHFYGECGGESCIEIFRLENYRLLEDDRDIYPSPSAFYEGKFRKLSNEKFELVKDLFQSFPSELLNENDKVIGQPDAGDWGGLYIEYKYNDEPNFWLLDQKKSNVPEYLHAFIDEVNEKIAIINN